MSEQSDCSERQDAIGVLSGYDRRMDILQNLLSGAGQRLSGDKKADVVEKYRSLKDDLKADKHRLERTKARGEITHSETAFVLPAVAGALTHLKPATNSNPVNSRWFDAVYAAHVDIDFALAGLRR